MSGRTSFTADEARRIGEELGIDWPRAPFDIEQFRMGMDVELEHGLHDLLTNVTDDDAVVTGKIALAHLNEFPDYTRDSTGWRRRQSAITTSAEPALPRAGVPRWS